MSDVVLDIGGYLSHFRTLLVNPQSQPQQAFIAYALVVMGVLVALLVLGLLATPRPATQPLSSEGRRRHSGPLRELGILVDSVIIFSLALMVSGAVVSYQPKTCLACHRSSGAATSWAQSSHRDVACRRCHWGTDPVATIGSSVQLARMGLVWASNRSTGTETPEASGNAAAVTCQRCHTDIGAKPVGSSVRMLHTPSMMQDEDCTFCHNDVGHASVSVLPAMLMARCQSCHDGGDAPSGCRTCHVAGGFGPLNSARASDYGKVRISKRDCEGCHSTESCTACHGVYLPHDFAYAPGKGHARDAFVKPQVCFRRCHTASDCLRCHYQVGAHGPSWVRQHQDTASSYCNVACHHQSFSQHLPGVDPSQTFCDNCHKGR